VKRYTALLMRLFPAEFRERYGAEVGDLLAERALAVRRSEGRLGVARLLVLQSTDLLLAAHAERRSTRSRSAARRAPGSAPGPMSPGPHRRGPARLLDAIANDARLAWRALRRAPGFLSIAALTLALGIGATTAIFTVVNGVLLAPLPYPDADALVIVWHRAAPLDAERIDHTSSTYLTIRDDNRVFDEIGTWMPGEATITGGADPERVDSVGVTDGALRALGARPVVGRLYTPADTEAGAEPKVILGHGFWQRRYGGDRGVVGETLQIDGQAVEIIGVMGADFRFVGEQPAVYWPIRLDEAAMPTVLSFDYQVLARLAAGVTIEEANIDVTRLIPASVERYAWISPEQIDEWQLTGNVRPLKEAVVGDVGSLLWVLFGTVSIVLLIACANVANLFLVRAEARRQEIAVRTAMGASRGVLVRQFLFESVLLGIIGGVGGLAIAAAAVPLLLKLTPTALPRVADIGVDPGTLAFCFAVSTLAGVLFGVFPLSHYGTAELVPALKEGGRAASGGRRGNRLRSTLAVAEVALALVLLVGAGLMVRSFFALRGVDAGLHEPQRVLTFRLALTRGEFPQEDQAILAYEQLLQRIAEVPGVEYAGAVSGLTMERRSNQNSFLAEGVSPDERGGVLNGVYKAVAGDYFEAAGIPLLAGRTISWDDISNRRPVGLVTDRVARHFWGSAEAAVGKRIRHSGDDPWREVIGVVGDVRDGGLRREPPAVAFWPVVVQDFLGFESWLRRDMAFVVRARAGEVTGLLPGVRDAVWSVDADLPLADVATLDALVARDLATNSFALVMLVIAAGVAVALGTIGIYGVVAYAFAQRRREIGIRIALGAANGDIRSMVLRQGALVAAVGVLAGLAGAIGLARFLQSLLFDVGTLDPLTYIAAALVTGGVALLASYVPALRATRVDPVETLRR